MVCDFNRNELHRLLVPGNYGIISKLFWDDQGQAEEMLPVTIKGHPYIISSDEAGGVGGWAAACARGHPLSVIR